MPTPQASDTTASYWSMASRISSRYSESHWRSRVRSPTLTSRPCWRKCIRRADASTPTSFLPPASHTVTHSLQPRTRRLRTVLDLLDDLFDRFFVGHNHWLLLLFNSAPQTRDLSDGPVTPCSGMGRGDTRPGPLSSPPEPRGWGWGRRSSPPHAFPRRSARNSGASLEDRLHMRHAAAADPDSVEQLLRLLHPLLGAEVSVLVVAVALPASHHVDAVRPFSKQPQRCSTSTLPVQGTRMICTELRVIQSHRTCQVRGRVPSEVAAERHDDRFKTLRDS